MAPSPHQNTRNKQGASLALSEELKRYLETIKAEIIASFRHEIDGVNSHLTTLSDKVQNMEDSLKALNSEIKRIDNEINNLESKIVHVHDQLSCSLGGTLVEMDNRLMRMNNIVIRGLDECEGSVEERLTKDKESVNELLTVLHVDPKVVTETKRLGKIPVTKNRPRLLRVSLESAFRKSEIIRKSKILKNTSFKHVYVQPDLTPTQRDIDFKLRKELRERRDKGEDVVIVRGEVRLRSEQRNFHH